MKNTSLYYGYASFLFFLSVSTLLELLDKIQALHILVIFPQQPVKLRHQATIHSPICLVSSSIAITTFLAFL